MIKLQNCQTVNDKLKYLAQEFGSTTSYPRKWIVDLANEALGVIEAGNTLLDEAIAMLRIVRPTCPNYNLGKRCGGFLTRVEDASTCLGTISGVDSNEHIETYHCNSCDTYVQREWTWKEATAPLSTKEKRL